jgi:hypothetical protein
MVWHWGGYVRRGKVQSKPSSDPIGMLNAARIHVFAGGDLGAIWPQDEPQIRTSGKRATKKLPAVSTACRSWRIIGNRASAVAP